MVIHRPLDHIFAARSQVAVLRVLLDTAHGLTGREIARQAGVNHQASLQALTRLEGLGLVRPLQLAVLPLQLLQARPLLRGQTRTASRSACRTHLRNVSAVHPSFPAIEQIAAQLRLVLLPVLQHQPNRPLANLR